MLVPGEGISQQRLGDPVMVEPGPPLTLREKRINPETGQQPELAVIGRPSQVEPGPLLIALFPLRLVILLKKVDVADPAGRPPGLPASDQVLSVSPEGPATEGIRIVRIDEVVPVEAEFVDAVIDDEPGVSHTVGRSGQAEKLRPVVNERTPETRATKAEVVDIKIPIDPGRSPADTKHLKDVPTRQHLGTKDLIVLHLQIVDVKGRLFGVGRQHRPPEHRDPSERDRVPPAGDKLLMLDRWLAGDRINHRHAKGPGHRHLLVGER